MNNNNDTIAAIATSLGTAAISIIRLSGPQSVDIIAGLFTASDKTRVKDFSPYRLYTGLFKGKSVSDRCMCVVFKAPNSYTGEDCAEIHCHGGVKLTECILNEILSAGARAALHGEFTKRAFLNGKLDLSAAEGVAGLINAQSEAEINAGFGLLAGTLKNAVAGLQNNLTAILAEVDAAADYPEEYDGKDLETRVKSNIQSVLKELTALEKTYRNGALIRNGINCAVVGLPNTGKSSLMNALLGFERVIVTPTAGTTRDTVAESFSVKGIRVNLIDTAGIRRAKNNAESLGIERSKAAAKEADIVLYVQDVETETIPTEFRDILKGKKYIVVSNKVDDKKKCEKLNDKHPVASRHPSNLEGNYSASPLNAEKNIKSDALHSPLSERGARQGGVFLSSQLFISAKYGHFIGELKKLIVDICIDKDFSAGGATLNNVRHLDAVRKAAESLETALSAEKGTPLEMRYVDIKAAWDALGLITGATADEEIIETLFASFCVGK